MSLTRRPGRLRFILVLLTPVLLLGTLARADAPEGLRNPDAGAATGRNAPEAGPEPALLPYMEALSRIAAETAAAKAAFGRRTDPTPGDVDKAYGELAKTQAELRILTEEQDNIKQAQGTAEPGELNERLRRALKEAAELQKELDEPGPAPARPTPKPSHGVPLGVMEKERKPILVRLVGKQVVPLTNGYFTANKIVAVDGSGNKVAAIQIIRVKDGEPIQMAKKEGGVLAQLVKSSDPKKQYFAFLVCADAIDTFREARSMVSHHGFAFFWSTADDRPMLIRDNPGSNSSDQAVLVTPSQH